MLDLSPYEALSKEQLIERLAAAERVCLMYSWGTARFNTDVEKATHELWERWWDLAGGAEFTDPELHPELGNDTVFLLARKRDNTRAQTLSIIEQQAAAHKAAERRARKNR